MRKLWLFLVALSIACVSNADFLYLPKDKESTETGRYIMPNERGFAQFRESARGKTGAMISVGTFRGLMLASYGNFSDVVLLDLDKKVVAFNELQIEALRKGETLAEFLAVMYLEPGSVKLMERALAGDERALEQIRESLSPEGMIPKGVKPYSLEAYSRKYVGALLGMIKHDDGWGFLRNRTAYLKIRKLAIQKRLIAVQGNLAGDATLSTIGSRLKFDRIQLSVLDVSNAPDYILNAEKGFEFTANLLKLPFSQDAVVNFTRQGSPDGTSRKFVNESWSYYSVAARDFVRGSRTFAGQGTRGYSRFIRGLAETPADLYMKTRTCRSLF